jgi:hypothetical protein
MSIMVANSICVLYFQMPTHAIVYFMFFTIDCWEQLKHICLNNIQSIIMAQYCAYGRVIAARSTKSVPSKVTTQERQDKDNRKEKYVLKHGYGSVAARYSKYMQVMKICPNMHVTQSAFSYLVPRFERHLTSNKNWVNFNKGGEKQAFISHFALDRWEKLTSSVKREHSFKDCTACERHEAYSLYLYKHPSANKSETVCHYASNVSLPKKGTK